MFDCCEWTARSNASLPLNAHIKACTIQAITSNDLHSWNYLPACFKVAFQSRTKHESNYPSYGIFIDSINVPRIIHQISEKIWALDYPLETVSSHNIDITNHVTHLALFDLWNNIRIVWTRFERTTERISKARKWWWDRELLRCTSLTNLLWELETRRTTMKLIQLAVVPWELNISVSYVVFVVVFCHNILCLLKLI